MQLLHFHSTEETYSTSELEKQKNQPPSGIKRVFKKHVWNFFFNAARLVGASEPLFCHSPPSSSDAIIRAWSNPASRTAESDLQSSEQKYNE